MLLHKYTDNSGKDVILNSRLMVSDPRNFNDPFELALHVKEIKPADIKKHLFKNKARLLYYYNEGVKKGKLRQSWKEFLKENSDPVKRDKKSQILAPQINADLKRILNQQDGSAANYFLLCCFCEIPLKSINEILMWSHYSDGFQGLRYWIESELLPKNKGLFTKIKHKDRIVSLDPIGFITGDRGSISKAIMESLSVKSKAWEYEQEYRWFVSKEFCKIDHKSNRHFITIDLNAVKRIDFGVKSSAVTISEITEKVENLGLKIEFKKVIPNECEFKLDYIDL